MRSVSAWIHPQVSPARAARAIVVLRVVLASLLFIHGCTRTVTGGVAGFGSFLDERGFPFGLGWAWAVTLFELLGTPLLALGKAVVPLAAYYMFQLTLGIVMVHWQNGWFVVGGGTGGMEYSVLLITGFGCVLASHLRD